MKLQLSLSVLSLILLPGSYAFTSPQPVSSSSVLMATVYGADGEVTMDQDQYYDTMSSNDFFANSNTADLERLNNEKGTLARVAAAFPPPGHQLNINKIQDVSVLRLDESFLEMQAVVCEYENCVTVSVPVAFEKPCAADIRVDCALENLAGLDGQAQQVLEKLEWEMQHHEDVAAGQRRAQQVLGTDDLEYPTWWVPPNTMSPEMIEECTTLRDTLNEEAFTTEMKAMATFALRIEMGDDLPFLVTNAAIGAVSPMGVVMRALVQPADDPNEVMSVDVPIAFQKKAADVIQLRDFVMAAVEFVASS